MMCVGVVHIKHKLYKDSTSRICPPRIIMALVEPNFVDFPWELLPIGRRGWRWGGGKVVGQDRGRTVDGCKRKLKIN